MSTAPSHYSGNEGHNSRPLATALMSEDDLREQIIQLKETGRTSKQMDAYDLYADWRKDNTPMSVHTVYHAAHAYLLSGAGIESADEIAVKMKQCPDFLPENWGDWLADTAMVSSSRGKVAEAYNRLNESADWLVNAPSIKRLRNRLFVARINLKHGDNKPYSVKIIWNVRKALINMQTEGRYNDATLLRNVNWWLVIASARYPAYKVVTNNATVASPFVIALLDATGGKQWITETRDRHKLLLKAMSMGGRMAGLPISWFVIRTDRT